MTSLTKDQAVEVLNLIDRGYEVISFRRPNMKDGILFECIICEIKDYGSKSGRIIYPGGSVIVIP